MKKCRIKEEKERRRRNRLIILEFVNKFVSSQFARKTVSIFYVLWKPLYVNIVISNMLSPMTETH